MPEAATAHAAKAGAAELRADGVALAPGKAPITEVVRAGEIVGLSGLDGHGQERFLETLAGLQPARSGAVAASSTTS